MNLLFRIFLLPVLMTASPALGDDAPTEEVVEQTLAEQELLPILSSSAMRRVKYGVQVVDVATGEEVFAKGAEQRLVPASTMKLITAATALSTLGPSYAFTTDVYTVGELDNGVLEGDLYIRGTGDPTMTVERLWRLLRDVRIDGVERIQGDVILDDSWFVGPTQIPGWDKKEDLEDGPSYFPQVGALQLEFGALVLVVRPGGEPGKAARVSLETAAGNYVAIDNGVSTGSTRARTRLNIERDVSRSSVRFTVDGTIRAGHDTIRYRRAVPHPSQFFRGVTEDLLQTGGPNLTGQVRLGTLPAEDAVRVRRIYSPPLASILMDANKYSSNFMAETVLRAVGAEERGEGSYDAGLSVVREYLTRIGVPRSDFIVQNGSGLSRETRMTPSVLTAVLLDMASNPQVGAEFAGSMSIAGVDGTLSRRLTEVPGQMRGKTGTLNGVHALAGFVDTDEGRRLAYAFLVNDVPGSLYPVKGVQDDFLRRLMTLPVR